MKYKRFKIAKNFYLDEFVPEIIYKKFGIKSIWFIDKRIVELAQFYRDYFGKGVTINTWFNGGKFSHRGFRVGNTVGATYSQHKYSRAFDSNISGITPNDVRKEIMKNEQLFMEKGLTTLESGKIAKTWIHSDIRHTNMENILIVK